MPFCTECGNELLPGAKFCTECGTDVLEPNEAESAPKAINLHSGLQTNQNQVTEDSSCLDVFSSCDWLFHWTKFAQQSYGKELGIILTDVDALANMLNCDENDIKRLISNYIQDSKSRGVNYCLLDIQNNAVQRADGSEVHSVVELLKKIINVVRPKYLFILGNEEIVNVISWENKVPRADIDVLSDLPYVTLDTNSPFRGQRYDFINALHVGRLPCYSDETFEEFETYFKNATQFSGKAKRVVPFGLSTATWDRVSNGIFSKVASGEVEVSPDIELDNVEDVIQPESNLLYFNLHGSNEDGNWYGQGDFGCISTFSPDKLDPLLGPYFIAVEACYGARYTDSLNPEESIVLKAVQNGCLAMLGSSKIAMGATNDDENDSEFAADTMVGSYIKELASGNSAGEAFCAALQAVEQQGFANKNGCKIYNMLTVAEFSLYGDPSVRLLKKETSILSKAIGSISKSFVSMPKGLHIPMPDILEEVRATPIGIENEAVQAFMKKMQDSACVKGAAKNLNNHNLNTSTKFYQLDEDNYVGCFEKDLKNTRQSIHRIFDRSGKIKAELASK